MITVPSESLTFCKVRSVKPPVSNSRNGYSSGIRPNSSKRPAGHQPPQSIPCFSAASSAARSTPVCPPEIIFTCITVAAACRPHSLVHSRHSCLYRKHLLFAVKVIGLFSFHDYAFVTELVDFPFPAIRKVGGFADRIVGDNVIDQIFLAGICDLVRLVRRKNEGVASGHFCRAVLVAGAAFAGDDKVEFPLRRMRMIWEIRLAGWHTRQFQIKRMPFCQIERVRIAAERFRNSLEGCGVIAARRFPFPIFNVLQIYFSHFVTSSDFEDVSYPVSLFHSRLV